MHAPTVTIIVARARNGVIGEANTLPWRLPEDLKHFRETTLGHALVMGRKTFDSIGRPLPGRRIIVLSRDPGWHHPGCERAASLPEAIALAGVSAPSGIDTREVFVAGGADVYRQALPLAHRVVATEIDRDFDGDAHFPALAPARWRESSREVRVSADGLPFAIVEYRATGPDHDAAAQVNGAPPNGSAAP